MAVIAKFRYGTTDVLTFGFGGGLWNTVSWVPRVSAAGEDVEETITVLLETATDDVMATQIQYIDDLILRVDRYRTNPAYETPVWLHAKRNDETGERRAVVKRMSYVLLNSEFDCEAMQHQTQYQFTITRGGYWERTTARTFPDDPIVVANILHSYDYTATADIVGDVPARVELLVYGLTDVDRAWFGIRSAAVRQIANFEGTW